MFNFFTNNVEWDIYNNATRESIKMFGIPCKYMKRENVNIDYLFGEDNALSEFNEFIEINLYLEDMTSFGGASSSITKFGLVLDDTMNFLVNQNEIVEKLAGTMPNAGDLLMMFDNKDIFEVMHVDDKLVLYPFGKNTSFRLYCKKFHYGHEMINTGIPNFDELHNMMNTTITIGTLVEGTMTTMTTVTAQHQTPINQNYLDFTENDPYKEIV